MKKIGVFSYRVKLILIWCVVILLATGMVSLGLTYNATRQMLEDQKAHLELLTEQVLINFINQTEAVARQLNNQVNSTGLSAQLYAMRDMTADSAGYYHATQSLLYALNQTITPSPAMTRCICGWIGETASPLPMPPQGSVRRRRR